MYVIPFLEGLKLKVFSIMYKKKKRKVKIICTLYIQRVVVKIKYFKTNLNLQKEHQYFQDFFLNVYSKIHLNFCI